MHLLLHLLCIFDARTTVGAKDEVIGAPLRAVASKMQMLALCKEVNGDAYAKCREKVYEIPRVPNSLC